MLLNAQPLALSKGRQVNHGVGKAEEALTANGGDFRSRSNKLTAHF
jgi:hypothetical protein